MLAAGYTLISLGVGSFIYGAYQMVRMLILMLRPENRNAGDFWTGPALTVKDSAEINLRFGKAIKAGLLFVMLSASGSGLLELSDSIFWKEIQGGL